MNVVQLSKIFYFAYTHPSSSVYTGVIITESVINIPTEL